MKPAILMTGFPGFIASRLAQRLVRDRSDHTHFFFLVQDHMIFTAERRCRQIEQDEPSFAGRWTLVEGDITRPDLGVSELAGACLRERVNECWHLAALYDLAADQSPSYHVNVDGTIHVLDFCESLGELDRLHYISTCYVSGTRHGRVYEDELDCGQEFKNHYEATKFWAEKQVRHRMDRLPTTIYRPAIVVGDSTSGEIAKGDGPYFVLDLLTRLPKWLPFVKLGGSEARVNLIPVDYVVDAMARLSLKPEATGRTFHLADPDPRTAAELTKMFCSELGRAPVVATVPDWVASRLIDRPAVCRALGIPRQSFDYFEHTVEYDTRGAAELLAADRPPPPRIGDYLANLIDFAARNPEIYTRGAI